MRQLLIGAAAWVAGCGSDFERTDEQVLGTDAQGLSAVDQCFTTPRDKQLTGGGEFTTNTSYAHNGTGCENGYLIDLDNYATRYNLGTTVMYAGAEPTNATDCPKAKMRAYVWERLSNGGKTFLGQKMRVGSWVVDGRGVGHCILPALDLEESIPNYRANGTRDYRIALRAELENAAGTGYSRREIAFATVEFKNRTPAETMQGPIRGLGSALGATPPGQLYSGIQGLWAKKDTILGAQLCRSTQLDHTLFTFSRRSFLKAGGTAFNVDGRITAIGDMHKAFCTAGGTALNLQDALLRYISYTVMLNDQIRTRLFPADPHGTEAWTEVSNLMSQIPFNDLGRLVRSCGLESGSLTDYLTAGVLPPGVTADRLLLGSCSTQDPATVAANLGVGANFRGQTSSSARAAYLQCMKPPDASGNPRDVCNDPRAQGGPGTNEPDGEEDGDLMIDECLIGGVLVPCTEEMKEKIALEYLRMKQQEAQERAAAQARAREAAANQARERAAGEAKGDKPPTVGDALRDLGKAVLNFAPVAGEFYDTMDLADAVRNLERALGTELIPRDKPNCIYAPAPAQTFCGMGNQMCGADFAPGAFYQTSTPAFVFPSGPSAVRELNKADRLSHCLCDMMVENYGIAGDRSSISASCPTPEEREMHDCIANPYGPDDAVDRKCIKHLFPTLDEDAWRAKICQTKRCPEDQIPFIDAGDGSCDCGRIDTVTGRLPPCRATEIALCPPDNPGPCFCQPLDGGTTPNGGDPTCGRDVTTPGFVGAKDSLTLANPTDAFVHQFDGTRRALMVRPGHTSVGLTTFYENTLQIGPTLRTQVSPGARPAQGQNVDLQAYCTNLENNVHNLYMGECRLNSLTPGAFSNCDISLSNFARSSCATGDFDIEYVLNTASAYTAFTAIGSTSFAGALSSGAIIPACPRPSPTNGIRVIEVINPTWERLGGGITNPSVFWTFSSDVLAEIPRDVPLLR